MVDCTYNHTRYLYKLHNLETKRVILKKVYIKWEEWKITDSAETMKMFHDSKK